MLVRNDRDGKCQHVLVVYSSMNRIDQIFFDMRRNGSGALMPFLTAGDPDLDTTAALLLAIQRAGAAVCELGIPFSDPIADGPVIQSSMAQALAGGVKPQQVLQMVADLRSQLTMGLVAMVSYSILYRYGVVSFMRDAAEAGFDGFIVPDLPLEEARGLLEEACALNLVYSMLVAPTTLITRAQRIAEAGSGFVYVLARAGLTGERRALPPDLPGRIKQLRVVTDLPMAVGFGIANRNHVREVVGIADAVIVGSAIMRRVAQNRDRNRSVLVGQIERFVCELAGGLRNDGP